MKQIAFILLMFLSFLINAQNSLLSMLDDSVSQDIKYLFKGTKVVNGQSVEIPSKNVLQFNIQHRFGPLNSGSYNLYGLDYAQVRFSFEYGISNWISLGIGRSSASKTVDGNIKCRLKRQTNTFDLLPFAVVTNSAVYYNQYQNNNDIIISSQMVYAHQLLLARKFSRSLTIQLSPTLIHYNAVDIEESHDKISLGFSGRNKITNRLSINAEYFYQLNSRNNENVLSFGFDIETGGHVFQLHLSNSPAMIEPLFITNSSGSWINGDIYFGFNISRVFLIKK